MGTAVLLCICCYMLTSSAHNLPEIGDKPLNIAAFNIQVLGSTKMDRNRVQATLSKVLQRYDLILVQEIRDSSQTAFPFLVQETNKLSPLNPFKFTVSERLGRSNSKEQYGIMYRLKRLQLLDTYQFDDGIDNGQDTFEREPFAVRFSSPTTAINDFAVVVSHVAPKDAVREIDALTQVYHSVEKHWNTKRVLLAGDFNADCSYVRESNWVNVSLRTDKNFHWLVKDNVDTTTGDTDCSYDRFVTASKELLRNVIPGSVQAYQFNKDLDLTRKQTTAVSDHYPIELQLKAKVNKEFQNNFQSGVSFVVRGLEAVDDIDSVRQIYRRVNMARLANFDVQLLKEGSRMRQVTAITTNTRTVMKKLFQFRQLFPGVIMDNHLTLVQAYLDSSVFPENMFINGLDMKYPQKHDVKIMCSLQRPYICEITVTKYFM